MGLHGVEAETTAPDVLCNIPLVAEGFYGSDRSGRKENDTMSRLKRFSAGFARKSKVQDGIR